MSDETIRIFDTTLRDGEQSPGCSMNLSEKLSLARQLEKLIRKLKTDRNTKALVLRVDSPGGSALASDLVAEQLREFAKKKPVIIPQGDVAALDEGTVVVGPVGDAVARLVLRMHSGVHAHAFGSPGPGA